MLHTEIKKATEDDLIALMKAVHAEIDRRHSGTYSNACSDSSSNLEAAIADLDAEITIHLNDQRVNARLDRHTGLFARAAA